MKPHRTLAVDPGSVQSAWLVLEGDRPTHFAIDTNVRLVELLPLLALQADVVVIERIESYGMPVGREVFDTVLWSGRFWQAVEDAHRSVRFIGRRDVKLAICHSSKANDASIRQALIDRYGGKDAAIGRQATPGPLHGVTKDVWAALALAVTYRDLVVAA